MLGTWLQPPIPRPDALRCPHRPRLPPCLDTAQPASHLGDYLAGSCSPIGATWVVSDPASVVALIVPCTPHILLPTPL